MRVAIKTLGCKVNTYESEAIWELFSKAGYERVLASEVADVYVINTCSVTNAGERKSRQAIRKVIRLNENAVVCAVGCYTQLSEDVVAAIDGVDIILGTSNRHKIVEYVEKYNIERKQISAVSNIMKEKNFEQLTEISYLYQTRAFIKIQEGCNNFCTFCIIPWARGLIRSQSKTIILKQINDIVSKGFKEIVLTGIHTGGYGEDLEDYSFANLLSEIDDIKGLERIRISSIEINQLDEEVLSVLKKSNKFVPHLHIPIQAGSDSVLKKMRRNYTVDMYKKKIQELREIFPDIAITTDIIVGFPQESDELFDISLKNVEEIGFAELHVFAYSIRNGTPAARMSGQIDEKVKKQRVRKMIDMNDVLALKYCNSIKDNIATVLIEQNVGGNKYVGHTEYYTKVEVESDHDICNTLVNVEIIEAKYPINTAKIVK